MRKIPKAVYLSATELEDILKDRLAEADALQDGPERRVLLREIAQLRTYADAKRWMEYPGLKSKD